MEGEGVALDRPPSATSSLPSENSMHNGVNTDEVSKVCPLCRSEVRLFFVHLDEKILMCENTECEFPFGHEELKFVKVNDALTNAEELSMTNSHRPISASSVSSSSWSDKTNCFSVFDSLPDTNSISLDTCSSIRQKDIDRAKEKEQVIEKNLEDIKELNKALFKQDKGKVGRQRIQIKNQKWIRNLKNLQKFSGMQLLKPEEMNALKKEEPVIGLGELKIDIDPGNKNSMSSITIEIHNEVANKENEITQESSPQTTA